VRTKSLYVLGVTATGGHDLPSLQEGIANRNRLIEQPAGIVSKIDDEALELFSRQRRKLSYRLVKPILGAFGKLSDTNESHVLAL